MESLNEKEWTTIPPKKERIVGEVEEENEVISTSELPNLTSISCHKQCFDENSPSQIVYKCIEANHKVLVLMRGVPGSGKTTLARSLQSGGGVIYSADDYFFSPKGVYKWDAYRLEEVHKKNFERTRRSMDKGTTPIFVDNTNIHLVHMSGYVKYAVRASYEVYFLEPETGWKFNTRKCAELNSHGVDYDKIKRLIEEYEKVRLDFILPRTIQIRRTLIEPIDFTINKVELPNLSSWTADNDSWGIPDPVPPDTSKEEKKVPLEQRKKIINTPPGFDTSDSKPQDSPNSRPKSKSSGLGLQNEGVSSWKNNIPEFLRGGLTSGIDNSETTSTQNNLSLLPAENHSLITVRNVQCQATESDIILSTMDHPKLKQCDWLCVAEAEYCLKRTNSSNLEMKERPSGPNREIFANSLHSLYGLFPDAERADLGDILERCGDLTVAVHFLLDAGFEPKIYNQETVNIDIETNKIGQPYEIGRENRKIIPRTVTGLLEESLESEEDVGYVTLELGSVMCDQLQALFGPVTDQEIPTDFLGPNERNVRLPLDFAAKFYTHWLSTIRDPTFDFSEIEFPFLNESNDLSNGYELTQVESDEQIARQLWHKENNLQKSTCSPQTAKKDQLSSKLKQRDLHDMYPLVDANVLDELFADNNYQMNQTLNLLKLSFGLPQPLKPSTSDAGLESLYGKDGERLNEGDIENMSYNELRKTAQELAKQRDRYYQQAQDAFIKKQYGVASHYSDEGKKLKRLISEENRIAGEMIIKQRNTSNPENVLDLHGLHVPEATSALRDKLKLFDRPELSRNGLGRILKVNTGRGVNSVGGAKIKPAVTNWLKQKGYIYTLESQNPGVICVQCL